MIVVRSAELGESKRQSTRLSCGKTNIFLVFLAKGNQTLDKTKQNKTKRNETKRSKHTKSPNLNTTPHNSRGNVPNRVINGVVVGAIIEFEAC